VVTADHQAKKDSMDAAVGHGKDDSTASNIIPSTTGNLTIESKAG